MSIVSRVSDILTANLNVLLDRAENPEALLAQAVREMEIGLGRARRSTAVAIAAERRLSRERDEHCRQAESWRGLARDAVTTGRDDLARQALSRSLEHEEAAGQLQQLHAEAADTARDARGVLRAFDARLAGARQKANLLTAWQRTAEVRIEVYRYLGAGRADLGASLARFDRLESRLVQAAEELAAEADLAGPDELETAFADLDRQRAVERELTALKGP